MIKKLLALSLLCHLFNPSNCQDNGDYYDQNHLRYENYIYKENISSVQVNINNVPLSDPIIQLGSAEQLKLSFDDHDRELKNYYYKIIHCNANWEPSGLFSTEYIEGVPEDLFTDYKYSRNTRYPFIHHYLVFPNENMKIIKSGNYLIKVYEEGNEQDLILTWRFLITEELVKVQANVYPALDPTFRFYKQQIDFSISGNSYSITNPYDDLKVTILQNGRWDNAHKNISPQFVKGDIIEYGNNDQCLFNGENEFRYFDFKNLNYTSENVASNFIDSAGYNNVVLKQDKKRTYSVYLEYREINGKMHIKNDMWGDDNDVDADYAKVHFNLYFPSKLEHGEVYIQGQLTNWVHNDFNKMSYDPEKKSYTKTLFLKQGYYNYQYVLVPYGKSEGNASTFEGSHSDTENTYTILVYHRSIGDDYDRLIAYKVINSKTRLKD